MNNQFNNQVTGFVTAKRVKVATGEVVGSVSNHNLVVNKGLATLLSQRKVDDGLGGTKVLPIEPLRIAKVSANKDAVVPATKDIGTVVATSDKSLLSNDDLYGFIKNQGMAQDDKGKYLFSINEWRFGAGSIKEEVNKVGIYSAYKEDVPGTDAELDPDSGAIVVDAVPPSTKLVENDIFAVCQLTDSEGEVTSIKPFEDEELVITYESRWYLPANDIVIPAVNMGAIGSLDITIRPVGILPNDVNSTKLLMTLNGQFGYQVMKNYWSDVPAALTYATIPLADANQLYLFEETVNDLAPDMFTVKEVCGLDLLEEDAVPTPEDYYLTITVNVNTRAYWATPVKSAILHTSRGLYYIGFSLPIDKDNTTRRTISFSFTFNIAGEV